MYTALNKTLAEMTAPGQMFAINDVEVAGRTVKTWALAPQSMREVWLNAAVHGDADYLVYDNERLTYAQAQEQVARIANWMVTRGIGQHDRVAIAMRNYPEWMLAYWAVICIGAVPVGVNAWWVAEELQYGLEDCAAKLLICDSERLARFGEINAAFPDLAVVTVRVEGVPAGATPWSAVLQAEPILPEATIDPDDDACILYTSGTTGYPKGAQLTHRGCVNQMITSMFATLSQATAQAKVMGTPLPDPVAKRAAQVAAIVATPLFHVTANNGMAHNVTANGGKLVHMYKWDAGDALRIIEEERITSFSGVPTMGREIINHPDFSRRDTSSLGVLGGGGAAVQPDLIEKIGRTGKGTAAAQGYGMTETCGMVSGAYGIFLTNKPNSAGRVAPIFEVKCIDAEDNTLALGETGEICIRGVQIIKGYLNQPEATKETIVDGWLHTGDIGFLDEDQFIYIIDRNKDMVLRGGDNVYCSEVEVALYKNQEVAECAVFSVPDDRLGEEVGAAVFPAPNSDPSADDIRAFCKTKLAAYKVPRYIWIVKQPLPRNASGKFVKRELRDKLPIADAG